MFSLTIAFLVSLIATGLIVRAGRDPASALHDDELTGVQKFPAYPVPRVGGAAVALGLLAMALGALGAGIGVATELLLLLACGLPPLEVAGLRGVLHLGLVEVRMRFPQPSTLRAFRADAVGAGSQWSP